MKFYLSLLPIYILFLTLVFSCSTEEVIEETVTEEVSEDSEPTEEKSDPEEVKD